MEGAFYSCRNFEFFRDILRIKFPWTNYLNEKGVISNIKPMDIYNNFEGFSVIVTTNPREGVLIIPMNEEFNIDNLASKLEGLTRIKLEKTNTNGN